MCEILDIVEARGEARGEAKGEAKGKTIGKAMGEKKLITLINTLFSLNRDDDVRRVATDEAFRNQLYHEFDIN